MAASQPSCRLYIGNLLYQVQPEEIEGLFAQHDIPIKHLDISVDPFTGRNPSYCFVDFPTRLDATKALETLPGILLRGRPIKVSENNESRGPWNPAYGDSRCRKVVGAHNPALVFNRYEGKDISRDHWTAPTEERRRIWVSGLLHHDQRQVNLDMRALFSGWNIVAVSKTIFPRPELIPEGGQPHYYCFVDFTNAKEAAAAVDALDKHPTPNGGVYKLSIAGNNLDRKVCREQAGIIKMSAQRDLSKDWRTRT